MVVWSVWLFEYVAALPLSLLREIIFGEGQECVLYL